MVRTVLIDELLILGVDRHGHLEQGRPGFTHFLAAAALIDLELEGYAALDGRKISVSGSGTPGHDALRAVWEAIGAGGSVDPSRVIRSMAPRIRRIELEYLANVGVLQVEWERVLGVFPRPKALLPASAVALADRAHARVRAAVDGEPMTARTAASCALIRGLHWEKRIFPELSSNEAKRVMRRITEGHWADDAAQQVVAEIVTIAVATASRH
jgi:hypothetical protein